MSHWSVRHLKCGNRSVEVSSLTSQSFVISLLGNQWVPSIGLRGSKSPKDISYNVIDSSTRSIERATGIEVRI